MEWLKLIGIIGAVLFIGFLVVKYIAKRSLSEMSAFNVFLLLLLVNLLSEPIIRQTDNAAETLISTAVIVLGFILYSYLKNTNMVAKKIQAEPIVLIRHGNIDEKGLNKAKISLTEMLSELRIKGYSRASDVEFAILEETGKISILPNAGKRPVSTSDLSIVTGYEGLPVSLIIDGTIIYDNLAKIQLSPEQLEARLKMQGISPEMVKTVSLAILDEKNNLIIDRNDDTNQGNIQQGQQSFIKKLQEDLKAQMKEPEDNDLGIVDDYIKP